MKPVQPEKPRLRFPTHVALPFGFVVPIVYRSGKHVNSPRLGNFRRGWENVGYWDGKRIVVNRDAPLWDRAAVIAHELVHAVNDYQIWVKARVVDRAVREAGEVVLDRMEDAE